MNQLIIALFLAIAPISELRGGMPVAVDYAIKNNLHPLPLMMLIVLANIVIIFFLFLFLDRFHNGFMKFNWYSRFYGSYLKRIQGKIERFEKNHSAYGMVALALFVAIPFPTTGAWTGTIMAWLLGLDRKHSLIAIIIGVIMAGTIMGLASLGILNMFY
jgi:uncharacterized membrane protein